jgi:ABC-type spermidine/putrescine transport system permease subunit I
MLADDAVVHAVVDDFLERDGRMLVLCGSQVVLVSHVGAAIMASAMNGTTVKNLAELLESQFGVPPEQSIGEAVHAAVTALAGQGLVTVTVPECD